jgi:hypothetical protein
MARSSAQDLPEKRWGRAYAREMGIVFGLYGLLLGLSNVGLSRVDNNWRYAIVLLPILACAGLPLVIARMHDRVDERQREQMRTALLHSFAGTALITFAYGFLEEAGAPRQSMFWVWALMGAGVIVSMGVQRLRDR